MNFLMAFSAMRKIASWICKFLYLSPTNTKSWDNTVFLKDAEKDSAERQAAPTVIVNTTTITSGMSSFSKALVSLV